MNEQQFLDLLDNRLQKLQQQERADIRRDFEEYFENGRAEGKTTEEIITALGNIEELAEELLASYDEAYFAETVSIVKNDDVVPYSKVKVDVDGVNLSIVSTDATYAMIETKDADNLTEATMVIENDTLVVKAKRQERIRRLWFITIIGSVGKADVVIHLPKKQYEQITIDNDNGSIKVSDTLAKKFNLKSDNGRISTDGIQGEKLDAYSDNGRIVLTNSNVLLVNAESSNGRVVAENCKANQLKLESDNGKIQIKHVDGMVDARSSNGRIEAQMNTVNHPLNLVTENGGILLSSVSKLDNVEIESKTSWGSVTIYNEKTSSYAHGTKANHIKLKTSNGNIAVEELA